MIVRITRKKWIDQMSLTFDCLLPEEAHKIMDALMEKDMNELLTWMEVQFTYDVWRGNGERWRHNIFLSIDAPRALEIPDTITVEEALAHDRKTLETVKKMLMAKLKNKEGS